MLLVGKQKLSFIIENEKIAFVSSSIDQNLPLKTPILVLRESIHVGKRKMQWCLIGGVYEEQF